MMPQVEARDGVSPTLRLADIPRPALADFLNKRFGDVFPDSILPEQLSFPDYSQSNERFLKYALSYKGKIFPPEIIYVRYPDSLDIGSPYFDTGTEQCKLVMAGARAVVYFSSDRSDNGIHLIPRCEDSHSINLHAAESTNITIPLDDPAQASVMVVSIRPDPHPHWDNNHIYLASIPKSDLIAQTVGGEKPVSEEAFRAKTPYEQVRAALGRVRVMLPPNAAVCFPRSSLNLDEITPETPAARFFSVMHGINIVPEERIGITDFDRQPLVLVGPKKFVRGAKIVGVERKKNQGGILEMRGTDVLSLTLEIPGIGPRTIQFYIDRYNGALSQSNGRSFPIGNDGERYGLVAAIVSQDSIDCYPVTVSADWQERLAALQLQKEEAGRAEEREGGRSPELNLPSMQHLRDLIEGKMGVGEDGAARGLVHDPFITVAAWTEDQAVALYFYRFYPDFSPSEPMSEWFGSGKEGSGQVLGTLVLHCSESSGELVVTPSLFDADGQPVTLSLLSRKHLGSPDVQARLLNLLENCQPVKPPQRQERRPQTIKAEPVPPGETQLQAPAAQQTYEVEAFARRQERTAARVRLEKFQAEFEREQTENARRNAREKATKERYNQKMQSRNPRR